MATYDKKNIRLFQSALFQTNSAVIQTPDMVLVVDPNWTPAEVDRIRRYAARIQGDRPLYLLFTHSDYDHIIGYGAFPDAQVIASKAFIENPDKEKTLQQIRTWDDENYIIRPYAVEYPKVDVVVERDGQELIVGATKMTFYLAPGHNADGVFAVVEPSGVWIAGDYLCDVEFPYIYHSSDQYLDTIDKMGHILENHDIRLLTTGHGAPTSEVKEMIRRHGAAYWYIENARLAAAGEQEFDFPGYLAEEGYRFPIIMEKFHRANIELMEKELQGAAKTGA